MKEFLLFALCCIGTLNAQNVPVIRLAGLDPSGSFRHVSLDSSGALAASGSGNSGLLDSGYIPSFAAMGLLPSGKFDFLHLDSTGALMTTGGSVSVLPSSNTLPGTVGYSIARAFVNNLSNNSLNSNGTRFLFSDGVTPYITAAPGYAAEGMYINDDGHTIVNAPDEFASADIDTWLNLFMSKASGNLLPIAIAPDMTPTIYDVLDNHKTHMLGDPWIVIPQLVRIRYDRDKAAGIATANNAGVVWWHTWGAKMMAAFATIPRNSSTHLITVPTNDGYRPCTGFQETVADTGDNSCASVWYLVVVKDLIPIVTDAGDSASLATLTSDQNGISANIASLIDTTSGGAYQGLFWRDGVGGLNHANHDLEASSVFCYYKLGTDAQCNAIANVLKNTYSSIVNADGYTLISPENWTAVGTINSDGTQAVSGSGNGHYQDGYWSYYIREFNGTLALASQALANQQMLAFANGINPTAEYYDRGVTAPGGFPNNLLSTSSAFYTVLHAATPLADLPVSTTGSGYGSPVFSNLASGASVPSDGNWSITDAGWVYIYTPPSNITGPVTLSSVTFGKTWVNSGGSPVYSNCYITQRLGPSGIPGSYVDSGGGTKAGITVSVGSSSTTLVGGTTYAFVVGCIGTEQ